MSKIGLKLKQIRLQLGYTQEWVSIGLGLSESASGLRKIENGQTKNIKSKYLKKAAVLFKMTEEEIENYTPPEHGVPQNDIADNTMHQTVTGNERKAFEAAIESYKTSIQTLQDERQSDKTQVSTLRKELKHLRREVQQLQNQVKLIAERDLRPA